MKNLNLFNQTCRFERLSCFTSTPADPEPTEPEEPEPTEPEGPADPEPAEPDPSSLTSLADQ